MDDSSEKATERLLSNSSQGAALPPRSPSYEKQPVFYPPDTVKRSGGRSGGCSMFCTRYATYICVALTVFAAICHITSFSTMGWAYHDVHIYKLKFGLWRYLQCWDYTFLGGSMDCFEDFMHESNTGDWKMDMKNIGNYRVYITGWIRASQTLESLALVGYIITCGLIIGHIFSSEARENRNVEIAYVICSVVTMLLAIVGAITYAVNMMERCWYSSADCSMGYSFGLVIAGCIMSIIAATLKVLDLVGMFRDYNANPYDANYKGGY